LHGHWYAAPEERICSYRRDALYKCILLQRSYFDDRRIRKHVPGWCRGERHLGIRSIGWDVRFRNRYRSDVRPVLKAFRAVWLQRNHGDFALHGRDKPAVSNSEPALQQPDRRGGPNDADDGRIFGWQAAEEVRTAGSGKKSGLVPSADMDRCTSDRRKKPPARQGPPRTGNPAGGSNSYDESFRRYVFADSAGALFVSLRRDY